MNWSGFWNWKYWIGNFGNFGNFGSSSSSQLGTSLDGERVDSYEGRVKRVRSRWPPPPPPPNIRMTLRRSPCSLEARPGTQDVAEDLKRQICRSARYGRLRVRSCTCQALDEFDVTALPLRTIAIFVTSTTGQGDPPDNMRKFWRFLCRKSLPLKSSLPDLNYAVFGLGDSSYPKYNVVARKLYKRLEDLGAEPMVPLLPLSLGDERAPKGGHFAALDRWVDALLASMARVTGAEGDGRPPPEAEDEAERCPLRASVVPAPAPGSRAVAFDLEAEARRCFEALGGAAWRSYLL